MALRQLGAMAGMATRDFAHEARLSLCSVLGIAAVLAPILVLFGLKHGVVSTMTARLLEDPRVRAIQPIGQGRYDPAWFAGLRALPETGFVVPSTRFLAATISLRSADDPAGEPVPAQMQPTAAGDPLLPPELAPPPAALAAGEQPVVLSRPLAEKLRVVAGAALDGRIGRTVDGEPQSARLRLRVAAVLAAARADQDVAFVALPLLDASEDYREGFAVPAFEWTGRPRPEGERLYASFRLFAARIDDVARLRDWLAARRVDSVTRAAEIETIQRLDRGLTALFAVIAGLAALGYLLTLTVSLWSTVLRKQRDLSLLRLVGFPTGAIALFPMVHAAWAAVLGSAAAVGLAYAVAPLFDRLFADQVRGGNVIFRLLPEHAAAAVGATIAIALVAASWGGLRAAAIAPGEGLRDE